MQTTLLFSRTTPAKMIRDDQNHKLQHRMAARGPPPLTSLRPSLRSLPPHAPLTPSPPAPPPRPRGHRGHRRLRVAASHRRLARCLAGRLRRGRGRRRLHGPARPLGQEQRLGPAPSLPRQCLQVRCSGLRIVFPRNPDSLSFLRPRVVFVLPPFHPHRTLSTVNPVCGNGIVEGDEECDEDGPKCFECFDQCVIDHCIDTNCDNYDECDCLGGNTDPCNANCNAFNQCECDGPCSPACGGGGPCDPGCGDYDLCACDPEAPGCGAPP